MVEDDLSGQDDFIFAIVESKSKIQKKMKPGGGFPPKIEIYEPSDDDDEEWTSKSFDKQVEGTLNTLNKKTMKSDDQIFFVVGTNVSSSSPFIDQVLKKLDAEIISFYNPEHDKILLSSTKTALDEVQEKIPKYLQNYVRMIRPLSFNEQVSDILRRDWKDKQMVVINMMPNIDETKLANYVAQTRNFLTGNNTAVYEDDLGDDGLVFAESDFTTIKQLVEESTFVYRVQAVPQGLAESIKVKHKKKIEAIPTSLDENTNNLPTVIVMDTGVNPISSLSGIIIDRQSHGFSDPDDSHDNLGHGTAVASLSTFGEKNGNSSAKIISYKIWSPENPYVAYQGMLNGIKKFRDVARLFVTSIGLSADLQQTLAIDRIIQQKNICFVCSAGNIQYADITREITSGKRYPNYLKDYPVVSPGSAINAVAVGSIAKNKSSSGTHPNSLAKEGNVSPYSCCGADNPNLLECKKPDVVESGSNVNFIAGQATRRGLSGIESFAKSGRLSNEFFGTSFSSPLFMKKLAEIERKYGHLIKNVETLKAILFASCKSDLSSCVGYGQPLSFVGCNNNNALCLAEGTLRLSDKSDKEKITVYSDEVTVKIPNSSIGKITLCIVHSDDYRWDITPTLGTYIRVEAHKTGSDSLVEPINYYDLQKETNVKLLTYSFEKKSMEATWRFDLIPELTKKIPAKYRGKINVRYGCAILLSRKPDETRKSSVTQEVLAVK